MIASAAMPAITVSGTTANPIVSSQWPAWATRNALMPEPPGCRPAPRALGTRSSRFAGAAEAPQDPSEQHDQREHDRPDDEIGDDRQGARHVVLELALQDLGLVDERALEGCGGGDLTGRDRRVLRQEDGQPEQRVVLVDADQRFPAAVDR